MYDCVMRSGGYLGFSTTGVERSAPASNRSFCTCCKTSANCLFGFPSAIAAPIAALASSQSAYATNRASFFETREKSLNPVVPSSPVRV